MTYGKIKYYGTLLATFFVLLLSTEHISEVLKVVEKSATQDSVMTWLAAAGLQVFEVLTGMGVADLIAKRKRQFFVMVLLVSILILFFLINVSGNILFAFANMTGVRGRDLTLETINQLDELQKFWVLLASIPIPLMGIAGITVQAIFRMQLQEEVLKVAKTKAKKEPVVLQEVEDEKK